MPLSDEVLAWVTLARAPALDSETLSTALERLGSAGGIMAASDAVRERSGIPARAREYLRRGPSPGASERKWLEHARHHLLPFTDARYPQLLRSFPHHPVALYAAGSIDTLCDPQLAVVGSRNPTAQGCDTAYEFSQYLAERGLAITSGLAQGIDSCAHRGALAVQGITLAVFGCGLDVVYPRSNAELSEAIEVQGVLISEFALGSAPLRAHFPQRNRIIAGLSLGTLVIEAALGSGSLITARAANELGREVFAVPGSIQNPLSRGCHGLIKEGAKLADTPDDILRNLNFSAIFASDSRPTPPGAGRMSGTAAMDKDHKILLDALGFDPADLDMLVGRTGFKPEAVSSMMLILELEGHVQAAPGGRYSRVVNRRAGGER